MNNCVCCTDWKKAFDSVNWAKFREILKETGIDWSERTLISKLYMDQSVTVDWTKGRQAV
jgi:hypothetical protein